MKLKILLAGVIFALLGMAAAMSDIDRQNWHKATAKYFELSPRNSLRSYRTNLGSYKHVHHLELKALAHARSAGVLPIAKYAVSPASGKEGNTKHRVYFSSVITPADQLGKEMRLKNKNAFAFWKHQSHTYHLLHVDTLSWADVDWPLQPLEQVVRQSP